MGRGVIVGIGLVVAAAVVGGLTWALAGTGLEPIRVGILHSETGPMAISEKAMIEAEVLAIEQINANGGLLGRRVSPVIADGKSDPVIFAQQADRLITQEKVDVIIGCWTSASRKSVVPVIEQANHLMIYPMAYEGLEISPNLVYTGACANQQVLPAIRWCFDILNARKFFLIGSDYVWPHTVNAIAKDALKGMGGELVGEEYCPFGATEADALVAKIKEVQPDVVLSTIAGETNLAFYSRLRNQGITPDKIPVVSFSIAENELQKMEIKDVVGHYSAWNYFQSIDRPENEDFVRKFKAKYGEDRVANDVTAAAYNGIRLWAQAVDEAKSALPREVMTALLRQSLDANEGVISVDPETRHTWRPFFMGRTRADGQFDLVWSLPKPIRPEPYPLTRSVGDWNKYLEELYRGWGGSWTNRNSTVSKPAPKTP